MSLCASGPPVGALVLEAGTVIAEGRNHAYDPSGGDDRLQGSPIAHAEMNALAAVATGTDLAGMTVWSSHRPCSMCTRGVRIHRGRHRPVHRSRPLRPQRHRRPRQCRASLADRGQAALPGRHSCVLRRLRIDDRSCTGCRTRDHPVARLGRSWRSAGTDPGGIARADLVTHRHGSAAAPTAAPVAERSMGRTLVAVPRCFDPDPGTALGRCQCRLVGCRS